MLGRGIVFGDRRGGWVPHVVHGDSGLVEPIDSRAGSTNSKREVGVFAAVRVHALVPPAQAIPEGAVESHKPSDAPAWPELRDGGEPLPVETLGPDHLVGVAGGQVSALQDNGLVGVSLQL